MFALTVLEPLSLTSNSDVSIYSRHNVWIFHQNIRIPSHAVCCQKLGIPIDGMYCHILNERYVMVKDNECHFSEDVYQFCT